MQNPEYSMRNREIGTYVPFNVITLLVWISQKKDKRVDQ